MIASVLGSVFASVLALALSLAAGNTTASAQTQPDPRRSGLEFASPATQAMQRDDTVNPGMLWLQEGAALWRAAPSPGGRACAGCHGEAEKSMRGVAARYPAFDEKLARPLSLAQRINACRERHQQATRWATESPPLLSLEVYVAHQSRGLPLAPVLGDPRLAPHRQRGEALYRRRLGQLDLSCAMCHDQRAGQRLGGSVMPQAHATGYPTYRLEWQALGSLQRRLRGCLTGVRAEPFALDAAEWVELELYLATRSAGMAVETPAVRP